MSKYGLATWECPYADMRTAVRQMPFYMQEMPDDPCIFGLKDDEGHWIAFAGEDQMVNLYAPQLLPGMIAGPSLWANFTPTPAVLKHFRVELPFILYHLNHRLCIPRLADVEVIFMHDEELAP